MVESSVPREGELTILEICLIYSLPLRLVHLLAYILQPLIPGGAGL